MFHGTSDAGLPDTLADVGCTTPGGVSVSNVPNERLAQSKKLSTATLLKTTKKMATPRTAVMAWAATIGTRLDQNRSSQSSPWPIERPMTISSAPSRAVTSAIGTTRSGEMSDSCTSVRWSFCQGVHSARPAMTTSATTAPSTSRTLRPIPGPTVRPLRWRMAWYVQPTHVPSR